MTPVQTIDTVLRRVVHQGWTLRAGRALPYRVELFHPAVDSFPDMMDEMFDDEPFGERSEQVDGHIFDDLLAGRLIRPISEGETWTHFAPTETGRRQAAPPVAPPGRRANLYPTVWRGIMDISPPRRRP